MSHITKVSLKIRCSSLQELEQAIATLAKVAPELKIQYSTLKDGVWVTAQGVERGTLFQLEEGEVKQVGDSWRQPNYHHIGKLVREAVKANQLKRQARVINPLAQVQLKYHQQRLIMAVNIP